MDIGAMISNPWVIGGGVILGLVLLMRGGGSEPTGNGSYSPNIVASLNAKAMDLVASQAHDASQIGLARANGDTQIQLGALNALTRLSEISSTQAVQQQTVRAGVYKTRIAADTAMIVDRQQNTVRLYQTYANVNIAKITANAQVKVAQLQADAAQSNMWGNIASAVVGAAGKVAVAAI